MSVSLLMIEPGVYELTLGVYLLSVIINKVTGRINQPDAIKY